MKRIGMFFLLAFVIGCSKPEFKEFSPDGKFKVLMPGSPQDKSQSVQGMQVKAWVSDLGSSGLYTTSAMDMPAVPDAALIDNVLDGSAKGQITGMGGTVTKTTNVTLNNKYPGRAVEATLTNKGQPGVAHTRIYLVKGRLYQLLVIGKESFVNSPDTTKFFDSFQIVSE